MNGCQLAARIDHTLLKPEATAADIVRVCYEAQEYGFATVCVNPVRVKLAYTQLQSSSVSVCAVVGFPFGANATETKAVETELAIRDGATEIDMVLNLGLLKDGAIDAVARDINGVRHCSVEVVLKVIIEASILTESEIDDASRICVESGADFVKTSTGLNPSGGASVDQVERIRRVVGHRARIKAAGGIRTLHQALALIDAGADRLGTSAGVTLVKELRAEADQTH